MAIVPLEGAGLGPADPGTLSLFALVCLWSPSLPFLLPLGFFPGSFVVAAVGWGLTPPTGCCFLGFLASASLQLNHYFGEWCFALLPGQGLLLFDQVLYSLELLFSQPDSPGAL